MVDAVGVVGVGGRRLAVVRPYTILVACLFSLLEKAQMSLLNPSPHWQFTIAFLWPLPQCHKVEAALPEELLRVAALQGLNQPVRLRPPSTKRLHECRHKCTCIRQRSRGNQQTAPWRGAAGTSGQP
eukprot:GGOE01044273.1.p2 GENE.GGOE01044273.1~~GGOE01044273.1.p2  ORF type:complete len:127 (+),score=3.17 GGOE01044273.1:177-557(+)